MTRNRHLWRVAALAATLAAAASAQEAASNREADHEALRALRVKVTKAINGRDPKALAACFAKEFAFTCADQTLITSEAELASYLDRMFGSDDSPLVSMTTEPKADILTRFVGENAGYCYGTSTETYTLRGGRKSTLKARWTALVIKEGGEWKVAAAHVGVNLLDNPVLSRAISTGRNMAALALVLGIAIGVLAGRRLGRRKQEAPA